MEAFIRTTSFYEARLRFLVEFASYMFLGSSTEAEAVAQTTPGLYVVQIDFSIGAQGRVVLVQDRECGGMMLATPLTISTEIRIYLNILEETMHLLKVIAP